MGMLITTAGNYPTRVKGNTFDDFKRRLGRLEEFIKAGDKAYEIRIENHKNHKLGLNLSDLKKTKFKTISDIKKGKTPPKIQFNDENFTENDDDFKFKGDLFIIQIKADAKALLNGKKVGGYYLVNSDKTMAVACNEVYVKGGRSTAKELLEINNLNIQLSKNLSKIKNTDKNEVDFEKELKLFYKNFEEKSEKEYKNEKSVLEEITKELKKQYKELSSTRNDFDEHYKNLKKLKNQKDKDTNDYITKINNLKKATDTSQDTMQKIREEIDTITTKMFKQKEIILNKLIVDNEQRKKLLNNEKKKMVRR